MHGKASFSRRSPVAGGTPRNTGAGLAERVLKLHPLRMNVNALWTSALALKGQP